MNGHTHGYKKKLVVTVLFGTRDASEESNVDVFTACVALGMYRLMIPSITFRLALSVWRRVGGCERRVWDMMLHLLEIHIRSSPLACPVSVP